MNNVYYRFVHLASNPEYGTMPAKLRMNVIGNKQSVQGFGSLRHRVAEIAFVSST